MPASSTSTYVFLEKNGNSALAASIRWRGVTDGSFITASRKLCGSR
jgi:hypothetical protein